MDVCKQIANEYSYAVLLKRQRELNGPDVPKVTAPAERPSDFYGDERKHSGVRADRALR